MISVILPVLNEEKTIGKIVKQFKRNQKVGEIIVVDDKSFDNTVSEAKKAGAAVVTSTKIGKGASMRDGFLISKGEIIVYLDGDVEKYKADIIEKITRPILDGKADFVKGSFMREAGRVTELVAKPLLAILIPELAGFSQPLSGMIAGRRDFFEKITFENDYGVDLGILIDMYFLGARIKEVNLGIIQHKMKSWRELGQMSREVSRAILKRALKGSQANLNALELINILRDQMGFSIKETLLKMKKMIVFDMDNTILDGAFIEEAANKFGFQQELMEIRAQHSDHLIITKNIALLLKGKNIAQILEVADKIPLISDAIRIIARLKKRGYIVGIITHSYDCVATHIKNKTGADFALAYELEFSNSVATGEVKMPSFFIHGDKSKCVHEMCKTNALINIAEKYDINRQNIIAVGDGKQDLCMVKYAGVGVSFRSKNQALNFIADKIIKNKSFKSLLSFAK